MIRVKILSFDGFQETAILPCTRSTLQVKFSACGMAHYATTGGKLLLSVDLQDNLVNYADPSVVVEHRFEGRRQLFVGNFISLKPKK